MSAALAELALALPARRRAPICQVTSIDPQDGSLRTTLLRQFNECLDSWLVATEPNADWLADARAHPSQVWLRVWEGAAPVRVTTEDVEGPEGRDVWRRITTQAPEFVQRKQATGVRIVRLIQVEQWLMS